MYMYLVYVNGQVAALYEKEAKAIEHAERWSGSVKAMPVL